MKLKKVEIHVKTTQVGSFESLIMVEFWLWKLILEELKKLTSLGFQLNFDSI
jgi:hypothetical protein